MNNKKIIKEFKIFLKFITYQRIRMVHIYLHNIVRRVHRCVYYVKNI